MDIRDYISSGILELYACNALPDEERREVEAVLARHPEAEAELRKIQAAMEGMAERMAKTPPPGSRSAFLDALAQETAGSDSIGTPGQPSLAGKQAHPAPEQTRQASEKADLTPEQTPPPSEQTNLVGEQDYRSRLALYKWFLAASVALLLISSLLAATFYSRWKSSSDRVIALQQQQSRLAGENKVLSSNYESVLAMLRNPSMKMITLAGTESHPESKAMVYWDPQTGKVVLDQLSLPGHDQEHQYQLWAIQGGQPVDAGVFDASEDTNLVPLKNISEAEAFAITLEPRGGSEVPTLDQMVVIGKI